MGRKHERVDVGLIGRVWHGVDSVACKVSIMFAGEGY